MADGAFVVPRGDGSVPLEAVDSVFGHVPLPVVGLVGRRGSAAARAVFPPVADAVRRDGDRRLDSAPAQPAGQYAGHEDLRVR
ncbi:hypothetical protein [Streptomyces sp. NPDC050585]|uniref:hypothetical protein n=1 Tax=Streptomyces sp. NPDC050585 TaxID=3365632 RepID=UPI0037B2DEB9